MGKPELRVAVPARFQACVDETKYLVEADDFARQLLWEEWHQRRKISWEQNTRGLCHEIATIEIEGWDTFPIVIVVFWARVGGKMIGFYNVTSLLAHHGLVDDWLRAVFPTLFPKRGVKQCDAMNFGNCLLDLGLL